MTYVSISFDGNVSYIGNRPHGNVTLYGPGSIHGYFWTTSALVDTGSDFLHLPEQAANAVGISLANAHSTSLLTAGGVIQMKQQRVIVDIQGTRVYVPVNFGNNAKPLIGMQAIFKVLRTSGFSTTEWLLDPY